MFFISFNVRDHIPIQQGLRPLILHFTKQFYNKVRDHIPIQQGLRQSCFNTSYYVGCHSVRDHIPLQQGLRRS